MVWGEFNFPNRALVSLDGSVSGETLDLAYARIDTSQPDWGVVKLHYSSAGWWDTTMAHFKDRRTGSLKGYWKSERWLSEKEANEKLNWFGNRDALTLSKTDSVCQLTLRPSPGGKQIHVK